MNKRCSRGLFRTRLWRLVGAIEKEIWKGLLEWRLIDAPFRAVVASGGH